MKYRLLGSTGLIVSRIAFGTWTFTARDRDPPSVYKVDPRCAGELVSRALDAGINFFDTADRYAEGDSETMLGEALKGRRNDVIVATKVGTRTGRAITQSSLSRRHILWSVDQSLRRLGSDWIDVYIAHVDDPYTPLEETLSALDHVVRDGKVRYIGFSNWPAWRVAAACEIQRAHGLAPLTHGQMHYSLVGRDIEQEVIPALSRYRLGLTVWSPLAAGFLTGKHLNDPGDHLQNAKWGFLRFDRKLGFQLIDTLRAMSIAHGVSIAQIAIAWLLEKQTVSSVIVGTSTIRQLDDNLGALDVQLTSEEMRELDERTQPAIIYPGWFNQLTGDREIASALDARTSSEF